MPAADAISAFAQTKEAATYAGEALTDNANKLVVHLTSLDPSTETALTSLSQGTSISFDTFPTTLVAQLALQEKLTSDVTSLLNDDNIDVVEWGVDDATGQEFVKVFGLNDKAKDFLIGRYGAGLEVSAATERAFTDFANRNDDTSPFNGGDFVSNFSGCSPGNYEDCSTGFPVHNSGGGQYLLTAGHCFTVGTRVYNNSSNIPFSSHGP